jgi:hypothetical protein
MSNKLEATFHGPSLCGAEHQCERPANNPPHICMQPLGHFPATPHQGFTPFTWTAPEPHHTVVIP